MSAKQNSPLPSRTSLKFFPCCLPAVSSALFHISSLFTLSSIFTYSPRSCSALSALFSSLQYLTYFLFILFIYIFFYHLNFVAFIIIQSLARVIRPQDSRVLCTLCMTLNHGCPDFQEVSSETPPRLDYRKSIHPWWVFFVFISLYISLKICFFLYLYQHFHFFIYFYICTSVLRTFYTTYIGRKMDFCS